MKLHLLVCDCGDGSYTIKFVVDESVLEKLQELYDDGVMDYENGWGVDGDGFHYTTLHLPEDTTIESLGISKYSLITHEDLNDFS